MKMYCKIKRPDNSRVSINKDEYVVIQEKIDGSNTAIYNDNGNIRYFSRTRELKEENGLGGFINWIKQKEELIKKYLPNGWILYGEWLEQGKINYNSLAKQGKIAPYYVFDVATKITAKQTEDDDFERVFASIDIMQEVAKNIGVETVPELDTIKFNNYEDIKNKYVDNQKSNLKGTDCIREGVVIKTLDGSKRIKLVADKFTEVKSIKNKNSFDFIDKYITPMRITKFLMQIDMQNAKTEDYGNIFKKLDVIAKDILEEEKEAILKDLEKIIKRQAVLNIKEYLQADKEEKNENKENENKGYKDTKEL